MDNVTADRVLKPFPDIFGNYIIQIRMYPTCGKRQRRLDSLLGESGRTSRPIRLRHFPHAPTKFVSSKIYIVS
jgi:hypothetical protein